MKRLIALVAALAMAGPSFHAAAAGRPAAIDVSQPWSRPAVAGGTGVGFMTLTNTGGAADTLAAVESPVSRRVEIHRTVSAGAVISMQRQASLPLAPGAAVVFAPGGYHLMFIGLKRALKVGDTIPATLVFASGKRMAVGFRVATTAPAAHHGHDMSKM